MGCAIELIGVEVSARVLNNAENCARHLADVWEDRFSRFRAESELSRLNNAQGSPTRVSPQFVVVLDRAIEAYRTTAGRFDPTILPSLMSVGYNRDFAEIASTTHRSEPDFIVPISHAAERIAIDRIAGTVALPIGCALDFGGIAKGMFVDQLVEHFAGWLGGCVNAGGDLRVWGQPPDGEHWIIGIENPFNPDREALQISILRPEAAAIATSAMNRRVWEAGGRKYHHLIEPATGRPLVGPLSSITVLSSDVRTAEIATKSMLVSAARGDPLHLGDASAAVTIDSIGMPMIVPGRFEDAYSICPLHSPPFSA